MTQSNRSLRSPGTTLLVIARLLFNEHFITAVVHPTIADLQSEVAAAGPNRVKRLRARWRGYRAFWMLMLAAPFASWADEATSAAAGRAAAAPAIVMLVAVLTLGAWTMMVAAAAAVVAFFIHAWYERHPCDVATPRGGPWRSPQINFSSTDVAGNIGGLIFVVGSVLIVSLGVPPVFWFLCAGTFAACFLAWGLVAWHAREADCAGRRPRQLL